MAKIIDVKVIDTSKARAFIPSHYALKLMRVSAPQEYDNEYGEGHYSLNPGDPKLEGTCGEHWSPEWKRIVPKYLLEDGTAINPEEVPCDQWILIQTNPDREERKKNITWVMPAEAVSDVPFKVGKLTIDPAVDVLCMGGDVNGPTLEWGVWPVKKAIFVGTYEEL